MEELIEKFRYKKNKAAFAQSKIKYLERIGMNNVQEHEHKLLNLAMEELLKIDGVTEKEGETYNQKWLLETIEKLAKDKRNVYS